MYHTIKNPETGRNVSIYGKIGQKVLRNYMNVMNGGGDDEDFQLFEDLPACGICSSGIGCKCTGRCVYRTLPAKGKRKWKKDSITRDNNADYLFYKVTTDPNGEKEGHCMPQDGVGLIQTTKCKPVRDPSGEYGNWEGDCPNSTIYTE